MKTITGLAITGTLLVLASPSAARDRPVEVGEYRNGAPARAPAQRPSYREEAPPAASTARIVGGVRLSDHAELGVGLFPVVGPTEREIVRRRTDPGDFRARDGRSAGLGLSLRF